MATKTEDAPAKTDEAAGGGKKKLIMIAVPLILVIAAAAWFFLLRGGGEEAAAEAEPAHEPGAVIRMDPITINLAGGHFLKLGMALQQDALLAGGHGEPDGAAALDMAIALFSGMSIDELATSEGREAAKAELMVGIDEHYHHEFYDIYFTEFVMQ